jgi:hypothetical protein
MKMEKTKTDFWNSLLTEKSWEILQELRKKHNFVLIGGWAVYLLTKQHKSKDIDIVISIKELEKFKEQYQNKLGKNDFLKRYEIKEGDIDIDIYVEYFSELAIPAEDIKNYAIEIEGFKVACPEVLLILKQTAFFGRKNSVKGEKDAIDIASLLFFSDINFKKYSEILKKYKIENYFSELIHLLSNFQDYSSLGLNPQKFKIKKKKILNEMKKS